MPLRAVFSILFVAALCARGQGVYNTTVDPCRYELTIPQPEAAVRGVWVFFDRGREVVDFYNDAGVFRIAERERLALLLARHCAAHDDAQTEGAARQLFAALDQLAQSSKHGELPKTKVIAFGFGGAGPLVARLSGIAPDRVLAVIAYAPGQLESPGLDTVDLPPAAAQVPQLIIANGADTVAGTRKPFEYFERNFIRGAPWVFAIQNGVPQDGGLANALPLISAWMETVLDDRPVFAPGQGSGWWLYIKNEPTSMRDADGAALDRVSNARVDKGGSRAPGGYVAAGWTPGKKAAAAWLDFVKKQSHSVNSKYP